MKKNLDPVDRLIRLVVFGFLLTLSYSGMDLPMWVQSIALVLALVLLFSIITGFSPAYRLFGYSTFKVDDQDS